MLDFRFLLGAVIVFVLTVLAGLRIFGATDPLLATMGDQPRVEAVALPRHIPTTLPNVPRAAKAGRPFVRPAVIEVPRTAVNDIAESIPREPPTPEVTGSVEPAQTQPAEPAQTDPVKPAETQSVEPAPTQEVEEAPKPRPTPRPVAQQRKKQEVTGSVAPAPARAAEEAPKARPKQRPVAQQRKKEPEAAKPFQFFFPFSSQSR